MASATASVSVPNTIVDKGAENMKSNTSEGTETERTSLREVLAAARAFASCPTAMF